MARINYDQDEYNLERLLPNNQGDAQIPLQDLYISKLELENLLDQYNLVKYDEVYCDNKEKENTLGYGGYDHALIIEFNEVNVINIWLHNFKYFEAKMFKVILNKLGERWSLSLLDRSGYLVDLENESMLDWYLMER